VIEKIVDGKMAKFYEEVCLLEQPFIKDQAVSIKELIAQKVGKLGENITVRRFARFKVGAPDWTVATTKAVEVYAILEKACINGLFSSFRVRHWRCRAVSAWIRQGSRNHRRNCRVHALGVEIGIVVGGGNFFRGVEEQAKEMDRVSADSMGMLSTVINAIACRTRLRSAACSAG
jgi:hypothetical protein